VVNDMVGRSFLPILSHAFIRERLLPLA